MSDWRKSMSLELNNNEIMTNAAAKVVEDAALGCWNRIKMFFKDVNARDEINMGFAYEEYLRNTLNKNSKVKTLIYRHVPKELYSFYECVGVRYNGEIIDTKSINKILEISNKVIITGTGGIGKTTMMKHFFLNTEKDTVFIPAMIELRAVNSTDIEDISIFQIIFNNLVNNGFKMEEQYFKYSMEKGAYVFLFDGYDEVNKDRMPKISSEIIALSNKYPKNKYVISSRPTDNFVGWNDFVEMQAEELTKEQALSLINKIEFDEKVKAVFSKELDERLYEKYQSFASNPLLLNIMLLTFDNRASIPDRLNDFYEQAFATLFNMHDATKEAYVRDIRTGLGCEDFKMIFAYFCFKSYFAGDYEFTESLLHEYLMEAREKFTTINFRIEDFQEDLTQSVCMLVKEGLNFRFSHRSFQEYFAAWYTCKLMDVDQKELLTKWLKESSTVHTDTYFNMLFNLQSEKVNKMILYPALKLIRKKYNEMGFSLCFLKYLFKGVVVNQNIDKDQKITYEFSLRIKNKYLCNVLQMTCGYNGYTYPEINKDIAHAIAAQFANKQLRGVIYFSEVLKQISEEQLLQSVTWFDEQVKFCLDFMQQIEREVKSQKRNVKDILKTL